MIAQREKDYIMADGKKQPLFYRKRRFSVKNSAPRRNRKSEGRGALKRRDEQSAFRLGGQLGEQAGGLPAGVEIGRELDDLLEDVLGLAAVLLGQIGARNPQ